MLLFSTLLCAAGTLLAACTFGNASDVPEKGTVESLDFSGISRHPHPRLLIDEDGFADIRWKTGAAKESNLFLSRVNRKIINYADKYVASPKDITYTLDASGRRLLEQSRSALRQLSILAYSYRVTLDGKYLSRAREILSQVCSLPDWHPEHFLDVGEMTMAAALAYDWMYDKLSSSEREAVVEKIMDCGLKAAEGQGFYNSKGNWNQVCNAGMVAGSLAIYECAPEFCRAMIEKSIASNRTAMENIYSPDGNYAEGYEYWRYGSGFQAYMMKMLSGVFGSTAGLETVPGFMKTAQYMLFMYGPCGPFSYADGGLSGKISSTGMWWFAEALGDKTVLANEIRLYNDGAYYSTGDETRLITLIPAVARNLNVDDLAETHPSSDIWAGGGNVPVVMVHTGWQFDDGDHYLGIKGGSASGGHGHMDAGSFVYDALGQRWSQDPARGSYTSYEVGLAAAGGSFWDYSQKSLRWDIMGYNNWGHSTITIGYDDGSIAKCHTTDHKVDGRAKVLTVLKSGRELGAVLDMTEPLQGQVSFAQRTIKLVDNRDLVIIDRITALNNFAAPVNWHMISEARGEISNSAVILSLGGRKMKLSTVANVPVSYFCDDFARPSNWEVRGWEPERDIRITGFRATVPAGCTITFTTTLTPVN